MRLREGGASLFFKSAASCGDQSGTVSAAGASFVWTIFWSVWQHRRVTNRA
jgi:hypothetical protein